MTTKSSTISSLAALCALALVLSSSPIHAMPSSITLDQKHILQRGNLDAAVMKAQSVAQTFTVGKSGILARVDIQGYVSPGTKGNFVLRVLSTEDGVPSFDEAALFSKRYSVNVFPTRNIAPENIFLTEFDLSDAEIPVQKGQILAIALQRGHLAQETGKPPWLLWRLGWSGPYYRRGGAFVTSPGEGWHAVPTCQPGTPNCTHSVQADAGFRTWVSEIAAQ